MNQEIEHKYLLRDSSYRELATTSKHICQGYLCLSPGRTVRVRRSNDRAYITIKAAAPAGSIARFEWEKEITLADFDALFPLCLSGAIDKVRYIVPFSTVLPSGETIQLKVEVDEFHGLNEGLILAEIEFPSEDTPFEKPAFLGEDVTSDVRYYNSYLSQHPFSQW